MPAPIEQIHVDQRRVGELHDEDAVARDGADRADIDLPGERMKGVENQPDRGMIGPAHDFPGVTMVVDITAPGQRLVADPEPAPRRALAEFTEVGGRTIDAAK